MPLLFAGFALFSLKFRPAEGVKPIICGTYAVFGDEPIEDCVEHRRFQITVSADQMTITNHRRRFFLFAVNAKRALSPRFGDNSALWVPGMADYCGISVSCSSQIGRAHV